MRICDYVIEAARRTPDALAVAGPDQDLSYARLDALAAAQAGALAGRGVGPGDRVVIWTGKDPRAVALMQAALRLGAVYVPVTAASPPSRVARIAADCSATVLAVDEDLAARARSSPRLERDDRLVCLADLVPADGPRAAPRPTPRPVPQIGTGTRPGTGPDDPAYMLYTSGSTGSPKGVCLSHRNAASFVEWAARLLRLGPGDRLANHAPFNFDLSVFDLYAAFHAGASVHLVPNEMAYAPEQLVRFIGEAGITVWYSVPSVLALMIRDGGLLDGPPPPSLRACVFAGEVMPIQQVHQMRRAWPEVRMLNWYGPTETNVCTSYEVTGADLERIRPLPIGRAASGDTVRLDPPGVQGEIVVSGPTVMLGYWGRPPQAGAYRTGDVGRQGADGELEYVGRLDAMVKIRGHRVELGEIEAVLAGHPNLADVAVVVVGWGLGARLHAVVVAADEQKRPGLLDLKRHCAAELPTYMIVDAVHVVGALPLTPNGKTDRAGLVAAIERGEL